MPRPWNPSNADDLIQRYLAGEAEQTLAIESGVERTAFRSFLLRSGIQRRNRRDAMITRMANTSAEERQRLTAAAHEASRGLVRSDDTVRRIAQSRQTSGTFIGRWEQEIFDEIIGRGFHAVPQLAIERYNVDIALWPLAVEVHSETGYPHRQPRRRQRVEYLFDHGWSSVYVMTVRGTVNVACITDQLVRLLQVSHGDPAAIGKYRMIRCSGELTTFTINDFD